MKEVRGRVRKRKRSVLWQKGEKGDCCDRKEERVNIVMKGRNDNVVAALGERRMLWQKGGKEQCCVICMCKLTHTKLLINSVVSEKLKWL